MEKLLSMTAVAKMIGVSRWTLRWWVKRGQGPDFKLSPGGRHLFRERDVMHWLANLKGPAVIKTDERKKAQAAAKNADAPDAGKQPGRDRNTKHGEQ